MWKRWILPIGVMVRMGAPGVGADSSTPPGVMRFDPNATRAADLKKLQGKIDAAVLSPRDRLADANDASSD